jgi:hypothetical protein
MKKIYKQVTGEEIIKGIDKENHIISAVVSNESIDRYNEVIMSSGWDLKSFKKHPVLVSSHDYYDLRKQSGEAKSIKVTGKELVAEFQYYVDKGNPEADWGWHLAERKRASFSVGFIPKKSERVEKDEDSKEAQPDRIYKKQELLEVSHVVLPANKEALQNGLHSDDMIKRSIAEAMRDCILADDVPEYFRGTPEYEDIKDCLAKGCTECDGTCNEEPEDELDKAINNYIAKVKTKEGELIFGIQDLKFLHACREAKDMTLDEVNITIKNMIENITTEATEQIKEKVLGMLDDVIESNYQFKQAKDEGYIKKILETLKQ